MVIHGSYIEPWSLVDIHLSNHVPGNPASCKWAKSSTWLYINYPKHIFRHYFIDSQKHVQIFQRAIDWAIDKKFHAPKLWVETLWSDYDKQFVMSDTYTVRSSKANVHLEEHKPQAKHARATPRKGEHISICNLASDSRRNRISTNPQVYRQWELTYWRPRHSSLSASEGDTLTHTHTHTHIEVVFIKEGSSI